MFLLRRNRPSSSRLQTLMLRPKEWNRAVASEAGTGDPLVDPSGSVRVEGCYRPSPWKTINSKSMGIETSAIDPRALWVLKCLQQKGFEAYLVGGCVRDLLLGKTPKDFDVVTTAELEQIGRLFQRSHKIGIRFPIYLVHHRGSCIEVSSFATTAVHAKERQATPFSRTQYTCNHRDLALWKNCMQRDFTINSLLYDPYTHTIYDYVHGIRDLKKSKVRTVIPACKSFEEDCARILRGIRLAARLGLHFSKETEAAMIDLASSIRSLNKGRLMMEMNFMLAYGAATPSIDLLRRFKLLEILLPFHDVYLNQNEDGSKSGKSSTMLMSLFSCLDKTLAANRPSDCSLWLGIMAFHLALVQHPQDLLVVLTFAATLYYGSLSKALRLAKDNVTACFQFHPEISGFSGNKADKPLEEEVCNFASTLRSSICAFTSLDALIEVVERYHSPYSYSSLVFVSENAGKKVASLFDVFGTKTASISHERKNYHVDFMLLKKGDRFETRFVLGKIIMDVLKGGDKGSQQLSIQKKRKVKDQIDSELKKEQHQDFTEKKEPNQMNRRIKRKGPTFSELNQGYNISKKVKERIQTDRGIKDIKEESDGNDKRSPLSKLFR